MTSIESASGRKLTITWLGSHVSEVTNDMGEKWTYFYTGNTLTKVCPPTSATACTTYTYGSNWAHPTAVQDASPHTYLRLDEPVGAVTAASSVRDNVDTTIGVYRNVNLGQPGIISQAGTAAGFNGTTSHVELPKKLALAGSWQTISLWFKTTGSGVLYGYQRGPLSDTGTPGWMPALYVGTDGKLRGEFYQGGLNPITSTGTVNNGAWHHAVLTTRGNTQSLYLDGVFVGSLAGVIDASWAAHSYIGAGKWLSYPATSGTIGWFNGSISNFAFYSRPLNDLQIALMHSSGRTASAPLTRITRPSTGISAQIAYDAKTGTVTQVTDENNGVWKVSKPQVSGTGEVYASTVMSAAPADYFRLTNTTRNEVNGITGNFSNVVLGHYNGPLGESAAAFDGSLSEVIGSGSSIDTSQSYSLSSWVYLGSKGSNRSVATVESSRMTPFLFGYDGGADRWRMLVCDNDTDTPYCPGVLSNAVPQVNTWTHLAATVDAPSKTVKLYVNGELQGTASFPAQWKAPGPFSVGRVKWRGSYADRWSGRLTEMATFGSVLTEGQVREQYAARDKARSYRQLPIDNIVTSGPNSVSLWFKLPASDTAGGVLYGYQSGSISNPGGTFGWNPALYVDTWGKLRGQFWTGSISPMASAVAVNDGEWHHAVLAASTNTQDLYLDGVKVATLAGTISPNGSIPYIGAGKWLNWSDSVGDIGYFGGEISDFAFHTVQLSAAQISAQFAAGRGGGLEVSGGQGTPVSTVALTDPANEVTKYLYDLYAGGRMIEQIDPYGGRTRFGYDEKGFLHTTADPNGNLTIEKHDVRGNVVERSTCQDRINGKCSTTYYSYYPNSTDRVLTPDPRNDRLLTVRDGRSSGPTDSTYLTQYGYDAQGNLTTVTDPLGRVTKTDYSGADRIPVDLTGLSGSGRYLRVRSTSLSSMNNNYSLWEVEAFDPSGANLSHRRTAAGSSAENASMDAAKAVDGDPTTRWSSTLSPAGPEWVQVDLAAVQAISRVRLTWYSAFAASYEIQVSNDAVAWTTIKSVGSQSGKKMPAGLPLRISKPNGAFELKHYTQRGDVSETVDAAQLVTAYTYDDAGRVLTRTVKSDGGDRETRYTYDAAGRVKTVTDPPTVNLVTGATHTRLTTTTYNVDGQITSTRVTDSTGGDAARESVSGYNLLGQKTSETDPRNKTTSYEYDLFGRTTKVTNSEGVATRNVYDKNGNRTETWLLGWLGDPNNPQAPQDKKIEARGYDPGGRLSTVTDAMGWTTEYRYTDNGLLKSATRIGPSASFVLESYAYDPAGNRTETVTNNGTTRVVSTVDAASRTTSETVDPAGLNRKVELTFGLDDAVVTTKISDGSGAAQYIDTAFDIAGRQVSQTASTLGTNGLAGHWKLTGGDASDSFGNSRGTATNITWPGLPGHPGAATFNGIDSEIVSAGPVIDTSQSFTISVLAQLADKATTRVLLSQRGQNQSAVQLEYTSSTDRWSAVVGAADGPGAVVTVRSDAAATTGFTHLAVVYDAAAHNVKLYVNGTLQSSNASVSIFSGNGKLVLGGQSGNRFKGSLQNLLVYQKALTQAEITAAHNLVPLPVNPASRVSTISDRQGFQTSLRDPNGNVTTMENDAAGRPARVTSAPVATEEGGGAPGVAPVMNTLGYNTFGERVESRDGRGKVTVTVRDAKGQATEDKLPEYLAPGSATSLKPVVKAEYDNLGRVKKTIDALLRETSYVYDQLGRVASVTQPNGGVTKYTYTLNGEQTSVTDPTGGRVEATYDYLGRKLTATQLLRNPSAAHTTTYGYHATSGFLASTTPPGRSATTYMYNAIGETTKVIDGAGVTVEFGYDFAGRRAFTKLADASKQTTTYDFAGRPLTQQALSPTGTVHATTSLTYDASGQVLTTKDARNTVTTFAYDVRGKLTQVVQPVTAGDSITTSFGYDAAGNRTRFTDGRNNRFINTYNAWNLLESTIEPATAAHPNEADRKFTTIYDIAGQPVEERSPGGVNAVHIYNALGQLTGSTGSGAEIATDARAFGYDLAGRLTSLSGSGGTNTITYDDRGLITSSTGPSGASSFAYTPDGLLQTRTDAAGTTTYGYDTGGRLSTVGNATAGIQIAYGYNNLSQVSQITYGSNQDRRVLGYATDGSHRLINDELKTSGGTSVAKITYGWDKNGNLTSKTTTGFAGASANSYSYDLANRLTSWTVGATTINYGWDKSGNRISVGLKNYIYDERNRLLSATDGRSWTYSARGTMRSMATGTVTLPTEADAFGQVVRQYTSASAYSENVYDGLGRLVRPGFSFSGTGNDLAADPNAKYVRGPGGALLGIKPSGAGVYSWTDLHTDVVGQFSATSTALSGSTTYDPFGQVLATAGMQGSLGYQSGWTDTATGRVNMHARWYNPESGAFDTRDTADLSPVPASINANRYTYGNGNPLVNIDPTGHEPMATGSDVEEAMYIASLPEAEAKAVKKAKSEAVKKAIKSGAGGPATGPPAKKGPPPPPAPPCITNHQADGSTDSNPFGCATNTGCMRNHDVDGSSTNDPFACVVQTDSNHVDDNGTITCISEDCLLQEFLNTPVIITGDLGADKVLDILRSNGYEGSPAMTYGELLSFASKNEKNWELVCSLAFGWAGQKVREGGDQGAYACDSANNPVASGDIKDLILGSVAVAAMTMLVLFAPGAIAACARALLTCIQEVARDVVFGASGDAAASGLVTPIAGRVGVSAIGGLAMMGRSERQLGQSLLGRLFCGGYRSFTRDTAVLMGDGTTKPIGEIVAGDVVQSADPETREKGGRKVTAVWAHKDSIVELKIDGKVLRTTEDHLFWNDTDREWQRADQLDAGDQLLAADRRHVTVNGITRALEYRVFEVERA